MNRKGKRRERGERECGMLREPGRWGFRSAQRETEKEQLAICATIKPAGARPNGAEHAFGVWASKRGLMHHRPGDTHLRVA